MNRPEFFAAVRPMFGGKLSAAQVAGIEAILDAAEAAGMTDPHHLANVLAQVRRETGGHMSPIKETVLPSHKDKSPSDATVIARLDKAFAAGRLKWVKKPYWRDGAFGRGPIQITHWRNYEIIGAAIGVNLRADPDLALDACIGAKIAVIGMRDGLFTGRKLADYSFPAALDAAPKAHPRRIVNGVDGSDREVTAWHLKFHQALIAAGWRADRPDQPAPGISGVMPASLRPRPALVPPPPAPVGVPVRGQRPSAPPAAYVAAGAAAVAAVWQWGGDAWAWIHSWF